MNRIVNRFKRYETVRKVQSNLSTTAMCQGDDGKKKTEIVLPPAPQDCCMSGCSTCVWLKYAEELTKLVENGDEIAKAKILENVKDPNLKAFLMVELSDLFKKKEK